MGRKDRSAFPRPVSSIYLNRDHPLYKRETKTRQRHMMHVARLITQEVAMMREPISARDAFDRQSLLLKDSFPA